MSGTTFQLHDSTGQRKYLTRDERDAFLEAAGKAGRPARTFCMTLAYTGSRVSEALALTADRVDVAGPAIVFESLKEAPRRPLQGRARARGGPRCPRPGARAQGGAARPRRRQERILLWPWGRATAWRRVSEVMSMAGISGPQASRKGFVDRVVGIYALTVSSQAVPSSAPRRSHLLLQTNPPMPPSPDQCPRPSARSAAE